MSRSRRALLAVALAAATMLVAWPTASRYAAAVELLESFATKEPIAPVESRELTVPGRHGPIRARLYWAPGETARRPVVIAHGVHYRGIDEERLVPFAENLAASGLLVLTPELADVIDYRITEVGADIIADSVRFMRDERPRPTARDEVGVVGFSFAGGLSLLAAREGSIADDVAYVMSVGGYHDLGRVMSFLVTSEVQTPHGTVETPAHEYGLVVAVYGVLDRLLPEADVEVMTDTFRAWLQEDRAKATELAEGARTEEGKHLFDLLQGGRLAELRDPIVRMMAERHDELERLSPAGRLHEVHAPVYLLHGEGDTVIPPAEVEWASLELDGHPHVALVSPLLKHVEVDEMAELEDQLALVDVMARLF